MIFKIKNLSPEAEAYIDACARIRNIPRQRLFELLIEAIARDQLVLGILDDDSRRVEKTQKHQSGYRRPSRAKAA